MRLPTTPAAVTRISYPSPSPPSSMHTVDVADAHAVVKQLDVPMLDVGVVPLMAKLSPLTVTL